MPFSARFALIAVAFAAGSSPAFAEIGGNWHITGEIAGRNFVVDCRFDPGATQFGGQCTSLSTGDDKVKAGKSYKLTRGQVNGSQVRWTYQTTVLFMGVDIDYAGVLNGDRMSGTISAGGRKGSFSGARK